MHFKDFYIKKTKVDFDRINKAMFEELQDVEHLKYNKLLEQFNKLLRNFSVKNGHVLSTESKALSLDGDFSDVVKSGKNYTKLVKKLGELKKKHRNLAESSFVNELLMDENQLNEAGFFDKFPHLK